MTSRHLEQLPTPRAVWDLLDSLAYEVLLELGAEYEAAFDYAHDHRDRPSDDLGKRIRGGGRSDPTHSIATGQQRARRILRRAYGKIERLDGSTRQRVKWVLEVFADIFQPVDEELAPLAEVGIEDQKRTSSLRAGQRNQEKRRLVAERDRLEVRLQHVERQIGRLSA